MDEKKNEQMNTMTNINLPSITGGVLKRFEPNNSHDGYRLKYGHFQCL